MISKNIKDSNVEPSSVLYNNVRVTSSSIGSNCTIGDNTSVLKSEIKDSVVINRNCAIDQSFVGFATYINQNSTIKKSIIGKFCCLSWNCTVYAGDNHNPQSPSMYTAYHWKHIFGSSISNTKSTNKTILGNDIWVGNGAIIINGVTIGDGAVIGAGAVVTKDVPPYCVVAGVPAKVIRKRFPDETIDRLLKIKWWDWPVDIIASNEKLLRIDTITEVSLQEMERITNCYDR